MAGNQHYERYLGVTKGSSWGTVVDVATAGALLHLNQPGDSWNIGGGITRAPRFSKNNNINKFYDQRHSATFSVSGHYDLNSQALGHLVAAMYGASTDSPAENNAGQADYLHNMDLTSATGKFVSLAGILESDQSIEAESAQPTSLTLSGSQNDPLRYSISGVVSKVVTSYEATPENTKAEIAGMTYPASPDLAFCNGTNLYVRINAQSGGGLSSSNDIKVESFTFTISRTPQLDYVFDGADTGVVQLPKYPSPFSEYSLSITLDRLDDAYYDVLTAFQTNVQYKAEIFVDGAQIGSGDNASIKIQIPWMQCVSAPNIASANATQMKPTITFMCGEAASAPTGMSGVTVGRLAAVLNYASDLA